MALRSVQNKAGVAQERIRAPNGRVSRPSVSRSALPPRHEVPEAVAAVRSALPAAFAALALTASAMNPGAVLAISSINEAKGAAKEAVTAVKQAAPSSGKFNFLTTSPPQVNSIQLENQNLRTGNNGYIQATREGSGSGAGASSGSLSGVNLTRDSFAGPSSGLPSSDELLGGASGALKDLKGAASNASSDLKGAIQGAGGSLQGAASSAQSSVQGASGSGLPGSNVDTKASTKPVSFSSGNGFNASFEVAANPFEELKSAAADAAGSINAAALTPGRDVQSFADETGSNIVAATKAAQPAAGDRKSDMPPEVQGIAANASTDFKGALEDAKEAFKSVVGSTKSAGDDLKDGSLPGSKVNASFATKPVSFRQGVTNNPISEVAEDQLTSKVKGIMSNIGNDTQAAQANVKGAVNDMDQRRPEQPARNTLEAVTGKETPKELIKSVVDRVDSAVSK
ncbi:hypothetical protein V8C86DRAFT_3128547 [Haematococcus lacustris]